MNQVIFVRQNWLVIFYAYAARDFHRGGRAARAVFGHLHDPLRAFRDVFFLFHAWKYNQALINKFEKSGRVKTRTSNP